MFNRFYCFIVIITERIFLLGLVSLSRYFLEAKLFSVILPLLDDIRDGLPDREEHVLASAWFDLRVDLDAHIRVHFGHEIKVPPAYEHGVGEEYLAALDHLLFGVLRVWHQALDELREVQLFDIRARESFFDLLVLR